MKQSSDILPPALIRLVRCLAVVGLGYLTGGLGLLIFFLIFGSVNWIISVGVGAIVVVLSGHRMYHSMRPILIRGFSLLGTGGSLLIAVILAIMSANTYAQIAVWTIGAPVCLMLTIIIREVTADPRVLQDSLN